MIHVVDSEMGSGKTTAMIEQMNERPSTRFLFITCYIEEVKRVYNACPAFRSPEIGWMDGQGLSVTKTDSLMKLLESGVSICSTHALFAMMNDDMLNEFKRKEYVLVCDETIQAIERIDETYKNIAFLLNHKVVSVDDQGNVSWNDDAYNELSGSGYYDKLALECQKGDVVLVKDRTSISLMRYMNPAFFTSFKEVFVLTYRFTGSTMDGYFAINKMPYNLYHAECKNGKYVIEPGYKAGRIDKVVHLICNDKLNDIGDGYYDLSYTWYNNRKNGNEGKMNEDIAKLSNNLRTFFERRCDDSKSKDNLFTTYRGFENMIDGRGYAARNCFCSFNTRATNEYRNKTNVAFMINRFISPVERNFFNNRGIKIDETNNTLNEMIQFIWRSAIRTGTPINLYIPSKRMRDMFIEWWDSVSMKPIDCCGEIRKYFFLNKQDS